MEATWRLQIIESLFLAESVEFLDEIDKERAKTSLAKAEEALANTDLSDDEFTEAQNRLFQQRRG